MFYSMTTISAAIALICGVVFVAVGIGSIELSDIRRKIYGSFSALFFAVSTSLFVISLHGETFPVAWDSFWATLSPFRIGMLLAIFIVAFFFTILFDIFGLFRLRVIRRRMGRILWFRYTTLLTSVSLVLAVLLFFIDLPSSLPVMSTSTALLVVSLGSLIGSLVAFAIQRYLEVHSFWLRFTMTFIGLSLVFLGISLFPSTEAFSFLDVISISGLVIGLQIVLWSLGVRSIILGTAEPGELKEVEIHDVRWDMGYERFKTKLYRLIERNDRLLDYIDTEGDGVNLRKNDIILNNITTGYAWNLMNSIMSSIVMRDLVGQVNTGSSGRDTRIYRKSMIGSKQ